MADPARPQPDVAAPPGGGVTPACLPSGQPAGQPDFRFEPAGWRDAPTGLTQRGPDTAPQAAEPPLLDDAVRNLINQFLVFGVYAHPLCRIARTDPSPNREESP